MEKEYFDVVPEVTQENPNKSRYETVKEITLNMHKGSVGAWKTIENIKITNLNLKIQGTQTWCR